MLIRNLIFTLGLLLAFFNTQVAQAQTCDDLVRGNLRQRINQSAENARERFSDPVDFIKEFLLPGEKLLRTESGTPVVIDGLESNGTKFEVDHSKPIIVDNTKYHAIIVGLGQAGLSAAVEMRGYRILGLERSTRIGGLATGTKRAGMVTDDGTAYQSPPYLKFQQRLYRLIGVDWERAIITSPSDTLIVPAGVRTLDGRVLTVFRDFWENKEVLNSLPASFAMLKFRLEYDETVGRIPDQPIHKFSDLSLDHMRFDQYVKGTPKWFREFVIRNPESTEARALVEKFDKEVSAGIVDKEDPTAILFYYISNYSNSAGGANPNRLHSITGTNFVIAETRHRATWPSGTGEVSDAIVNYLKKRKTRSRNPQPMVDLKTEMQVLSVKEHKDFVEVLYVDKNGQRHLARANTSIVSTPLDTTMRVIEDFEKIDPDKYKVIQDMRKEQRFADYAVITMYVKLEGRPLNLKNPEHPAFVKLTYDLWPVYNGPREGRPTDFISGHWQATKGYTIAPGPDLRYAVVVAYVPQGPSRPRTEAEFVEVTEKAIKALREISDPIQKEAGEPPIEVLSAATKFWRSSILVPGPGHATHREPILDRPTGNFGRIFIHQSGKGTPSNEEAQSQGFIGGQRAEDRIKIDRENERLRREALRNQKSPPENR